MKTQKAFTLLELLVVVMIMGILSTMALPSYQSRIIRAQISEGLILAKGIQKNINEYYQKFQRFPIDNAQAGLPKANYLIGNYVTQIEIAQGAIHIHLGNRINANVNGKILTLRPAVVKNSPSSPIAWLCGNAQAVTGMTAIGQNKTNIPAYFLDMDCREWQ